MICLEDSKRPEGRGGLASPSRNVPSKEGFNVYKGPGSTALVRALGDSLKPVSAGLFRMLGVELDDETVIVLEVGGVHPGTVFGTVS